MKSIASNIVVTLFLCLAMLIVPTTSFAANLYVSADGSGTACSETTPCSLGTANQQAVAGDRVLLRSGIYKTGIAPANSGNSETQRIIYESAPGHKARVDFGYALTGWQKVSGTDGVNAIYRTNAPSEKNRLVWIDDYDVYGRNTGLWRRDVFENRHVLPCDCIQRPGDYYISGGHIYLQTPDKDNPNNHKLIGADKTQYHIKLEGRSYITVRNMEFFHGDRISDANNAHYITLENNHFKNFRNTGMTINNSSSYWIIRGNYFQGIGGINTHAGDVIWIGSQSGPDKKTSAHHILIEDNVFRYSGHNAISTQYSAHHNVIRHNDFDLAWGKLTQGNGSFETWEHNLIRGSARASELRLQHRADHGTHSFAHKGTIYRFNKTWQNANGLAISQNRGHHAYGGVAYHNVIYGNIGDQHSSSGVHVPKSTTRGWHLVNNIIANCQRTTAIGKTANHNCVSFSKWNNSTDMRNINPRIENNIIFSDQSSSVWNGDTVANAQNRFPHFFRNNLQTAPLFVNPTADNPDFRLQAGSPAIDAGRFLTFTTNSGNNEKVVKVENAYFFMDGYGIVDGDMIKIGDNEPVRIESINYRSQELTLENALSWWNEGDGVSFDYKGRAPDIGLHEYGLAQKVLAANDDRYEITMNSSPVVHNILDNDLGEGLIIATLDQGIGGSAIIGDSNDCSDGAQRCVLFTVNGSFAGEATYTYTVEDYDGDQAQAVVTVFVKEAVPPAVFETIAFEAEAYSYKAAGESHQWEEVLFFDASSSNAMQAQDDLGASNPNNYVGISPRLDYVFSDIPTGNYYVWVRGHAQDSFSNDSVHVGAGGMANTDSEAIEFDGADQWMWSNTRRLDRGRATITVAEGELRLNLWMREDGVIIDKIVLTQNPDFVPTGLGPDASIPEVRDNDLRDTDTAGNLLNNPNFETGDKTSWTGKGHVVNHNQFEGNYAVELKGNPDGWRDVRQEIPVSKGTRYRFSGQLKVGGITQGSYQFQVRWFNAEGKEIRGTRHNFGVTRANTSYKHHKVELDAPATAVKSRLMLQASKAGGYAYYDAISIAIVDPNNPVSNNIEEENELPQRANLLNNAGFETGKKNGWSGSGNISNEARSGNYAFKLKGDPNRWRSLRQDVPVTANTWYNFSGYLSVSDISKGHYLFQVRWYDSNNKEISRARKNFGHSQSTTAYKYHSIELISPENAVKSRLILQAIRTDGEAYYDDLSVEAGSTIH